MSAAKAPKHVFLIDGSGFIFRAYYALPPMTRLDGTPVNAVFGFTKMLMKLIDDTVADHIAVIFDHARKTFRNDIYTDYKANREAPPEDLIPQFALVREATAALNVSAVEKEGFEADDLIATVADHVLKRRAQVRVITSDKDLAQLVREDGRVVMHDLARETTYDADGVRGKFGVDPAQIPDYLGLVGDVVDNLKGVPGVGAVSAAAILQNFENIETIPADLEAWSDVKVRGAARLAERIALHRERALRTKDLATVRRDVPGVAPSLRELQHRGADRERVDELFDRLGWHGIRDRIPYWAPG